MTYNKKYSLKAAADMPGVAFSAIKAVSLYEAQEHDLSILINSENKLVVDTIYGAYEFVELEVGTLVTIHSDSENSIFVLKDALVQNLDHFAPGSTGTIKWSDQQEYGQLPPNFQFTTIEFIERISERFIRLRLSVPDLSEYTDQSIHFRLVLPKHNVGEVKWPTVRENGSVGWPTGNGELHKPVYTARSVNLENGTLDLDIFLHNGGQVTEWAKSLNEGQQVAIIGPGGGGVPDTDKIQIFVDETAYPAAARILETLNDNTIGSLTLLTEKGFVGDYDFSVPCGVSVSWIERKDQHIFSELTLNTIENLKDAFFWFAGEKDDAMKVRKRAIEMNIAKEKRYIGSYWSRG
ncbi:MAG: siderophore-interacting protein [Pseudomonadota bacterium]